MTSESYRVTVTCDRCGKRVDGLRLPDTGTSGFYEFSRDDGLWGKYMEPYETILCDDCMWADPRYRADYGSYRVSRKSRNPHEPGGRVP